MNFDKASLEPCTEKQNWFQICITIYGGKNISCLFIGNNASLAPCSSERCKSPSNVNLQKRLKAFIGHSCKSKQSRFFFASLSFTPASAFLSLLSCLPLGAEPCRQHAYQPATCWCGSGCCAQRGMLFPVCTEGQS